MKKLFLILSLIFLPGVSFSQSYDPSQLEAMRKVSFLEGKWQGKGWISFGPGEKHHFNQTENIRGELGGSILTIHGVGRADAKVIHDAFAVISYDSKAQKYRMHSYKDGNFLDAEAKVGDDGSFIWGFEHPRAGKIRYTIRLNEKGRWVETGEFSRHGEKWVQNFEMTLDKIKETPSP